MSSSSHDSRDVPFPLMPQPLSHWHRIHFSFRIMVPSMVAVPIIPVLYFFSQKTVCLGCFYFDDYHIGWQDLKNSPAAALTPETLSPVNIISFKYNSKVEKHELRRNNQYLIEKDIGSLHEMVVLANV